MTNLSEVFAFMGIVVLGACALGLAICILSLPYAFVGWVLLAVANILGAGIDYGYWACFLIGFGLFLFAGIVNSK